MLDGKMALYGIAIACTGNVAKTDYLCHHMRMLELPNPIGIGEEQQQSTAVRALVRVAAHYGLTLSPQQLVRAHPFATEEPSAALLVKMAEGTGLRGKLMGQVNLVTLGIKHVRSGGSFTLISGQINDDPIRMGASGAMVNGGLEGFVRSAALELPRGLRINLISPTMTEESATAFGPFFPGQKAIPAAEAALGFVKSVEGPQTGRVYRIGWSRD